MLVSQSISVRLYAARLQRDMYHFQCACRDSNFIPWRLKKNTLELSGSQEGGHYPSPDAWIQLSLVTSVTTGLRSLTAACPLRIQSCQESCWVRRNVVSRYHHGHMQYSIRSLSCILQTPTMIDRVRKTWEVDGLSDLRSKMLLSAVLWTLK